MWLMTYELDGDTWHFEIGAETEDEAERHANAIIATLQQEGRIIQIDYATPIS